MPRTRAGYKFPHVTTQAKEHDHALCKVVEAVAARAAAGHEEWGTVHLMPPVDDGGRAKAVRNKIFGARNCAVLAGRFGELSVSVRYLHPDGSLSNTQAPVSGAYRLAVAVYLRDAARAEIIGRVRRGEPLAFNPYREGP
jgi:hypothetical protein